jgi:hypothetical protein
MTFSFQKINKFFVLLFIYHLIFTFFSYQIRIESGRADSILYWFLSKQTTDKPWLSFLNYGTDFMLFINYPLVKLGIPYWGGFLLYSSIGFLGILQWIKFTKLVIKDSFDTNSIYLLAFVFLLPNLHYWTSSLGKEALVFWGISSVFYAIVSKQYKSFSFIISSLLLLLIRPHVAFMLFTAISMVVLLINKYSFKIKMIIFGIASAVVALSLYMVFQISKINYWNFERIKYFNQFSILSFKSSGSYVAMLDYNYFFKWFSFYFRPLFYDTHNFYMILASMENILLLTMFLLVFIIVILYYKKIVFYNWMKIIFLYAIIGTIMYVERYANLGIFMRTKVMFEPFLLICFLSIIFQAKAFIVIRKGKRVPFLILLKNRKNQN